MLTTRVDTRGMGRVLEALKRRRAVARRRALVAGTRPVVAQVIQRSPRDTNRMARGFELAGNLAGVGPFVVSPVLASRYAGLNKKILGEQAAAVRREYLQARRTRVAYERSNRAVLKGRGKGRRGAGRQSSYYRKLLAEENKLLKALERAVAQQAQVTESSILIYNQGRTVNITVRPRIYGGDGEIVDLRDRSLCRITNREPHAIIRNRSRSVVAPALAYGRFTGVRPARGAYLKGLKPAAPRNVKG